MDLLDCGCCSRRPLEAQSSLEGPRWSETQASEWYQHQPWLVGSNFLPPSAVNELEMWQAETFDPQEIDKQLGWAESLRMNTMRVFLHDRLWQQDAQGFQKRISDFLTIAAKHHIRPIFVLFGSCWDPFPRLGPQHPPMPGVHNSGGYTAQARRLWLVLRRSPGCRLMLWALWGFRK